MIHVENLTKRYGQITAVDNLSFKIEKGEICGFLGPNGAGKTSTMRILTGYMPPTEGRATVAGFDVFKNVLEVKKRVGYLPESNPLYTDMRVAEYLDFAAELKGLRGSSKKRKVADVMEATALTDRQRSLISVLSKGYKQRVGLAQALLNDPEILILDEPSIGLDPVQITEIRSLIKNLSGKRTVILSTHILSEAQMICSRVIIINNGKLIAADTPDNLAKRMEKSGRITVTIEGPYDEVFKSIKALNGVEQVSASNDKSGKANVMKYLIDSGQGANPRKNLTRLVVEKNWDLIELSRESLSLEEVYLKLVKEEKENDGESSK